MGSQVSSWLEPPASQSRITRFCCFFSSPARAGCFRTSSPVMSAANAAAPAARVPRNRRRSTACSGEPQKVGVVSRPCRVAPVAESRSDLVDQ